MSKLLYLLSDSDLSDRVLSVLDENGFRIEDVVTKTGKSLFPDEHSVRSYNKVRKVSLDKPLLQRVFSRGTKDLLLYPLMGFGVKPIDLKLFKEAGYTVEALYNGFNYETGISSGLPKLTVKRLITAIPQYYNWIVTAEAKMDLIAFYIVGGIYMSGASEVDELKLLVKRNLGNSYLQLFDSVMQLLHDRKTLDISDGIASFHEWTLSEVLSFDFENKNLLESRISGLTLEEVGEQMGVTRERIRQIQDKVLKEIPILREERIYADTYMKYAFDRDDFANAFTELKNPAEVYGFLGLKYTRGTVPVIEYILSSSDYDSSEKNAQLTKYDYFLSFTGQAVVANKVNIFTEIMFENRDKDFTIESINSVFEAKVRELGLENIDSASMRGLKERSNYVISSTKGMFRYYNFDIVIDYMPQLKSLVNVAPGLYSIDYFYDADMQLMNDLDVRNSAELANLFKTVGYEKFENINSIIRQSVVVVGKHDKNQTFEKLLSDNIGETVDSFLDNISETSQIPKRVLNDYFKDFGDWVSGNVIISPEHTEVVASNQLLTDTEINELLEAFARQIMTRDELRDTFKKLKIDKKITPEIFKQLHLSVKGELVFSDKFDSIRSAMEDFMLEEDYFEVNNTDFYHTPGFYSTLRYLEHGWKLLKISPNKYINRRTLVAAGVNVEEDFSKFISEALDFMVDEEFYSYQKLIRMGFSADLIDDLGFNDVFYERLIQNSDSVRTLSTTPVLFTENKKFTEQVVTMKQFLTHQFEGKDGIDIEDFSEDIVEEFGLVIDPLNIAAKLVEAGFYYSKSMNRLYTDKEIYLNEVYGHVE